MEFNLGFALAWLLACWIAWLSAPLWTGAWVQAHPQMILTAAALLARMVPALILDRGLAFDITAHFRVGTLALAGRDIYRVPFSHYWYPYPPMHMYGSAALVWLAGHDPARFLRADKIAASLGGVGIALVIRDTATRLGKTLNHALTLGLTYALNPLPMLVSAYHGQFDELPMLLTVVAFLALTALVTG